MIMENHPFLMGKLTISMAICNSYVANYQRVVVNISYVDLMGEIGKYLARRIMGSGRYRFLESTCAGPLPVNYHAICTGPAPITFC